MLRYVTTNPGKVREAREYLGDEIEQLDYDYASRAPRAAISPISSLCTSA